MTPPLRPLDFGIARALVPSWAYAAALFLASAYLPRMNALELWAATIVLALPVVLALWHQARVRRLISLHQFRVGSRFHRWWSGRRAFSFLLRAILGLSFSAGLLFQSVFFGALEWLLIAALPLLHLAILRAVGPSFGEQAAARPYAIRAAHRLTQFAVTVVLAALWATATYLLAEAPPKPLAATVHDLQADWVSAPSGIVRWGLDAAAWVASAIDALGYPEGQPLWKLLVAFVVAPISVFGHLAVAVSGFTLPRAEVRRVFVSPLTAEPEPPRLDGLAAAVWAAIATVAAIVGLQMVASIESELKPGDSPLALVKLPECERIGGVAYKLNTIETLKALAARFREQSDAGHAAACQSLDEVERLAHQGVDAYLDWYFSLGAEWTRLAAMLTGDIDEYLRSRFEEVALSGPELRARLARVDDEHRQVWDLVSATEQDVAKLLEENRLVLHDGRCKVVSEMADDPLLRGLSAAKTRLATSAGTGLIAGAFAAKAAAKAMTKTSMKAASKVLAKAIAKKGASKLAGAAAGAALGAAAGSAVPGPGTAAGAVIGFGLGLVVSTGVDIAMLAAEEKLTRDSMRDDLLASVRELLEGYRDTFACK